MLIYKTTETVSFAHGELMMLGAFAGFALMTLAGWPFWLAMPMTVAVLALFGFGLERIVIRPILGQPAFSLVMLTIGIGYVGARPGDDDPRHRHRDAHAAGALQGPDLERRRPRPQRRADGRHRRDRARSARVLYAMFRYSRIGIAMQASSQNQLAAYYMGIPVKRLNGLVWGLAAAVAAIAGVLLAPITFVYANMGFIGLKAMPAAVVGGFGSLPGALVGGLVIGVVEALSGFYLPEGFKDIAPYVVVLIMLVVRPNGLFGEKLRKKVCRHALPLQDHLPPGHPPRQARRAGVLVRAARARAVRVAVAASRVLARPAHVRADLRRSSASA